MPLKIGIVIHPLGGGPLAFVNASKRKLESTGSVRYCVFKPRDPDQAKVAIAKRRLFGDGVGAPREKCKEDYKDWLAREKLDVVVSFYDLTAPVAAREVEIPCVNVADGIRSTCGVDTFRSKSWRAATKAVVSSVSCQMLSIFGATDDKSEHVEVIGPLLVDSTPSLVKFNQRTEIVISLGHDNPGESETNALVNRNDRLLENVLPLLRGIGELSRITVVGCDVLPRVLRDFEKIVELPGKTKKLEHSEFLARIAASKLLVFGGTTVSTWEALAAGTPMFVAPLRREHEAMSKWLEEKRLSVENVADLPGCADRILSFYQHVEGDGPQKLARIVKELAELGSGTKK